MLTIQNNNIGKQGLIHFTMNNYENEEDTSRWEAVIHIMEIAIVFDLEVIDTDDDIPEYYLEYYALVVGGDTIFEREPIELRSNPQSIEDIEREIENLLFNDLVNKYSIKDIQNNPKPCI